MNAKEFYEYQLNDKTSSVGRQDKEEIISLMEEYHKYASIPALFGRTEPLPSPKCDEACYYHCTKNGQQPPDCVEGVAEVAIKDLKAIIEKMDIVECDETWDYLKETRSDDYDLDSEREEEIFQNGFIAATEYFRNMLWPLVIEDNSAVNNPVCDFCGQPAMEGQTHCEKCSVLRKI
jgi:hypothetical protein